VELEGTDDLSVHRRAVRGARGGSRARCRAAYPIVDATGHSDIAPGRKTDPGPVLRLAEVPARGGRGAPVESALHVIASPVSMKIPAVVATSVVVLLIAGCSGHEVVRPTVNVSVGQQLIDLKKAREAGALSEKEYREQRESLIRSVE
jgi:hypothetical protein